MLWLKGKGRKLFFKNIIIFVEWSFVTIVITACFHYLEWPGFNIGGSKILGYYFSQNSHTGQATTPQLLQMLGVQVTCRHYPAMCCFLALFCAVGEEGTRDGRDWVLPTERVWWGHGGQERQWQDQSKCFHSFFFQTHLSHDFHPLPPLSTQLDPISHTLTHCFL